MVWTGATTSVFTVRCYIGAVTVLEQAVPLVVGLAIGLLLGIERERRKGEGPERDAAGVRTFALVAFVGSLSAAIPTPGVPIVIGLAIGALALASYFRSASSDPGITTEVALITAFLLGMLTQSSLTLAAGLAVIVTIVLASRETLHRFIADTLTEDEFHDALTLGAAALVILPLVPNEGLGPFQAFNPFTAWRLVVIVMIANAAGYIAQRALGPRLGLPLAGLFGGFVSSTATVAAMRTRVDGGSPERPAAAAAVLSNVATIMQLALVVGSTSAETLLVIAPALVLAGLVATAYGGALALGGAKVADTCELPAGRPFEIRAALTLAAVVSAIMFVSAILLAVFGERGAFVAAALGGLADAHAAAISMSSLVAANRLTPAAAAVPILLGVTTNSATKLALAFDRSHPRFAVEVSFGVTLAVAALWIGTVVVPR
jgi:uncharacterized membrane protein (DUF4010 family)